MRTTWNETAADPSASHPSSAMRLTRGPRRQAQAGEEVTTAHDPERWTEFRRHYVAGLRPQRATLAALARKSDAHAVTLLFAAHDTEHNNAVVLRDMIERRQKRGAGARRRAA